MTDSHLRVGITINFGDGLGCPKWGPFDDFLGYLVWVISFFVMHISGGREVEEVQGQRI